ncbi:MAG: GtrA family protein [Methanospirillum sp.]
MIETGGRDPRRLRVLYACVTLFGTRDLAAAALADAAGCPAGYAMNRRFTFRDPARPSAGRFGPFVLVALAGLLLSFGVIAFSVEVFATGFYSAPALWPSAWPRSRTTRARAGSPSRAPGFL